MLAELIDHVNKLSIVGLAGYGLVMTTIAVIQGKTLKKANDISRRLDSLHEQMLKNFEAMRESMTLKKDCLEHAKIIDEKIKLAIYEHKDMCNQRRKGDRIET